MSGLGSVCQGPRGCVCVCVCVYVCDCFSRGTVLHDTVKSRVRCTVIAKVLVKIGQPVAILQHCWSDFDFEILRHCCLAFSICSEPNTYRQNSSGVQSKEECLVLVCLLLVA